MPDQEATHWMVEAREAAYEGDAKRFSTIHLERKRFLTAEKDAEGATWGFLTRSQLKKAWEQDWR